MELYVAEDKKLEEIIIGSIITDNKAIEIALPLIKDGNVFFNISTRKIYESILELVKSNISIDIITISDLLTKKKELNNVGGYIYLVELMGKVSSIANIEHHIAILLQYYAQREVQKMSQIMLGKSNNKNIDGLKILEEAKDNIDDIEKLLSPELESNLDDLYQEILNDAIALGSKQDNEVTGINTGIKQLDEFTNGWQKSDLIVLAARPAMGKTAFALNSLLTAAKQGTPVLMYSLEMSEKQLRERLVAMDSEFDLPALKRYGVKDYTEINNMGVVLERHKKLPIHIIDKAGINAFDIVVSAKSKIRKHGIKMVFVDYIQLISGGSSKGNREQEISHISRTLKLIAKDMNIPIMALSQLSRAVENRQGHKRPMLSDLRESGAIEQDADQVMFLYRPEIYDMEIDLEMISADQNTEVIIAKNRSGSTGIAGAYFEGKKVKFTDVNPSNYQYDDVGPIDLTVENPF